MFFLHFSELSHFLWKIAREIQPKHKNIQKRNENKNEATKTQECEKKLQKLVKAAFVAARSRGE